MSTWHQDRNPQCLRHATKWAVVSDPPNECTGSMLFSTESQANEYRERLRKLGKDRYCYILSPGALL